MRTLTQAALTAKAIKEELKLAFSTTKFSVISENYAMGNAVSVSWSGAPTAEGVSKHTNKYQYGSFNGMTDSYDYDNKHPDIPQVMFVKLFRAIEDKK